MTTKTMCAASAALCALATLPVARAEVLAADAPQMLDPVQVDGAMLPTMGGETVLPRSAFASGRDTGDTLRDLAGVSGARKGGHAIDPAIRGLSQNRINVLVDGAYVHGGCPNRMDPPTAYAPADRYESVTVIRGTRTLAHGGGGPGGTILFERDTAPFTPEAPLRARVDVGYRGNGAVRSLGADVAGGNAAMSVRVLGSRSAAEDYADGDGVRVRSGYREQGATLELGYRPDADTRITLSAEQQAIRDALFAGAGMDSPESTNRALRLKVDLRSPGGPFEQLRAEFYNTDVEHVMDNYTLRPNAGPRMRAPSTSQTAGVRLAGEGVSALGRWSVGADLQHNRRDAERFNDGGAAPVLNSVLWPDVTIAQLGVFAELTHDLDADNRVLGGLRVDRVSSDARRADVDPPMMPMSPDQLYARYYDGARARRVVDLNVGALLRYEHVLPGGGLLFAGLSRSVRSPDATERYIAANGMTPDARWVGNPDLAPEKHHQVELGMQFAGERWEAGATVYYSHVSDFVLRDRYPVAGDNATIYRNVDATLAGGEASLAYRWGSGWQAGLTLAHVRAHNRSDGRPIAQTPPFEAQLRVDYRAARWEAGARMRAAATQDRVDLTSSSDIDGQGLDARKTPGWQVVDVQARVALGDGLSLTAGIDNLFDRTYAQHLNLASAFDPAQIQVNEPGRTGWVRLSATF